MKSIQFDTGIREYAINGDERCTIRIAITDMNLGKRIAQMQQRADAVAEAYRGITEPTAEQLAALDEDVRGLINGTFGTDVCTAAFGSVNCCSPVAGGRLLFEGFLTALTEQIRSDLAEIRPAAPRPAVSAYLDDLQPAQPALPDVSALTQEQRDALRRQLSE